MGKHVDWGLIIAGALVGGLAWHCIALMLFGGLRVAYWWERWVEMPTVIALCAVALHAITRRLRVGK